jgi:predicted transcriptional regulator
MNPMPNRTRKEPVVRVTVGLDLSEHERLSRLASDAGVSLAWTLRRAAREFLNRQEKQRDGTAQVFVLGRKRRA